MSRRQPEHETQALLKLLGGPSEADDAERGLRVLRQRLQQTPPAWADSVPPSHALRVVWFGPRLIAVGLVFVLGASLALWLLSGEKVVHVAAPAGPEAMRGQPVVTPLGSTQPVVITPVPQRRQPAEQREPERVDVDTAGSTPSRRRRAARVVGAREVAVSREPAPLIVSVPATSDEVTARPPLPAKPAELPTVADAVVAPKAQVIQGEDVAEMQEVARAEQLLVSDPEASLRLVRASNERFRWGYFKEERRYLEIMALAALRRDNDAALLARVFLRDYPHSAYRSKLEHALSAP